MHKGFIRLAALLGALTVALGAFAAHWAQAIIFCGRNDDFETGVKYQFYHVLALFLSGILYREFPHHDLVGGPSLHNGYDAVQRFVVPPGLVEIGGDGIFTWVGAITPLGGTAFIAGWICLFIAAGKKLIGYS